MQNNLLKVSTQKAQSNFHKLVQHPSLFTSQMVAFLFSGPRMRS